MSMNTNHGYPQTDHSEACSYSREHGDVLTSSDSKPTRILLLLYTYRYCLLLLIVLRRTSWSASISGTCLKLPACMHGKTSPQGHIYTRCKCRPVSTNRQNHAYSCLYIQQAVPSLQDMHVPTLALFTENINFLPFKGLFGLVENLSERFSGN